MGNQASADGAVVEAPPSPAPEGLPSTPDLASKPRVPPMSTKRPGGCGMAVPPQRHLAHAHTQQRLQTQPQSAYGTRQSVSERSSPTRWSNSPARTSVPAAMQGAKSPKSPTLLSPPPAPPPLPPGEVKKQELVQKLSKIVKSTSIKQVIENSSPTAHVVPENYCAPPDRRQSWLSKLTQTKEEALLHLKSLPGQASGRYSEPMSQEQVGHSVETSLGEDLPTFASYQGTIHEVMAQGLKTEMLDNFLFDEEGEQQLTTYEKWEVIRHAAEQMLQVYANRSNSSFIETEQWQPPTVVDANTVSQSGYAKAVDRAMSRGEVALMFIDDGRQCQLSAQEGDIAPLICTDLWQAIKELAPNKVPSTQRLEHLTAAGRHLLHASVSVETWYGASALMKTKAVVAVDSEQEHFFLSELQKWGWFGFMPDNVVILPLPRFHGFAEDQRTGKLAHVKNSAKLMLGTGYALFLLNSPAEAYTLSVGGEPRCLSGSVLSWLDDQHTSWLFSGLFSDVQRLRPEALVDVDFLAAALYCADRGGCNMAMEVVQGEGERDVRVHDSIVLRRGDAGAGSCALRASAMRTVRSYQIIQQNVPVSAGGTGLLHVPGPYLCTQRYAFKVPALQQLLIDATQFHMDVVLYGFYAYANFDLSDITTARNSSCACILAGGHKGPPMVDVVLGKNWLSTTAAPVLEAQDKVAEFRRKAMELLRVERGGATSPGHQLPGLGFKERRAGFSVVLFLTMEHGTASLALAAMRMARLFVLNIVDRLHLVTIIGGADNRSTAKAMLDDMVDKELDFQGQVVREVITRESGPASGGRDTLGCMRTYCQAVSAKLVVVPSSRLASSSMTELGGASSSLALLVLRSLTTIPVLLVKANSVGRFATSVSRSISATGTSGGGGNLSSTGSLSSLSPASSLTQRPGLVVMCHLDTSQASTLVESITPFLVPSQDVLYLARTQAFEKPGQLSMRSRRMFVQARMAVANVLKVEERAYASTASAELPKAVEAEGVDLLVVSASGSLAPSKEVEDIVRAAKAAGIYVHRTVEGGQGPAGTLVNNLIVQMALKHAQAKGMASPSVLLVPAGGAVHPRVPLGRNRIASRPGSKALVCRAQAAPVTEVKKIVSSLEFDAPPPVSNDEINRTVLSIILGGGAGSRLYPLTKKRAKPAVPLGANYRLIDIPVSNCINSNITKIYTLTQFNSASLNRHLSQAYNSSVGGYNTRGFVEVLAASQSPLNKSWFQGTADAVRQYMWLFDEAVRDGVEDFLILSGDHLYRMDYRDFVRKHKESGAAITIAALPCNEKDASAFGLMKIDSTGKVVEFAEKPKGEALTKMRVDTTVLGVDAVTAKAKPYIASMGIYVMKASALKELLLTKMPDANDFGNEIIPGARESGMLVQTFAFEGYWEDIGTVEAFYNSNLALANPATAQFSFYDKKAPIYTMSRFLPPSKIQDAMVEHAIIGDGCVIKSGSSIKNSVVGIRSLIGHDCKIENALIMGSDYYETLEECEFVPGCLPMGVGDGSEVRRAIIDKNARIGENCKIINKEGVKEANRENDGWVIKDGIIVIIKDSVIPSGTII